MEKPVCSVCGCHRDGRARKALGGTLICDMHNARWRQSGEFGIGQPTKGPGKAVGTCSVDGCDRDAPIRRNSNGLCHLHLCRFRKTGDVGPAGLLHKRAPKGKVIFAVDATSGYARVNGLSGRRNIKAHRFIMEQHLGRPLLPSENVHHINGDRADNRIENLELWTKSQPAGQRVTDKVAWAVEFLEQYAPELLTARPTQLRLA